MLWLMISSSLVMMTYDAFTVVRKVADDYGEAGEAEVLAADEILDNYSYQLPADVTTKGKLFVEGVGFAIMPVASDLTYGEAFVPEYFAHSGTTQVALAETETNKVNYIVKKGETTYTAGQWAQLPVGEYTVSIDMSNMADLVAGTNYSVDDVDAQPVTFNVSQKELTLTISDVTLLVGDTQDNLQKQYPINDDEATGILAGDEDKVKFVFSFDTEKVTLDNDQKLVSVSEGGVGAIKIAFDTTTGDNTYLNYKFPATAPTGKLILSDVYLLDLADENLPDLIQDAANNGNEYSVKLPARSLKADSWYTMVLPFATTPLELVQKLGVYAVTNRMKAADENKISFKLEFNELPANEPFLIKLAADKNLSTATAFTTKDITYAAEPKIVRNNNTFMGVYEAKNIQTTNEQKVGWLATATNSGSNLSNDFKSPKTAPRELVATEAYLIYPSVQSSPVITIEDFDFSNNTTAIKTLNAETMKAIEAEGMYNLNGMKLNSVPTQKGVYIINGKKVVIK